MFKTTRKVGENLFFTRKLAFFSKNCSQQPLLILNKWSYYFRSTCQNTSSNLINCCLRLVTLDNTRKKMAKIFSYWNDCFFSKFCVFQQLLRCYRSDVITSTLIVGKPFGPLQFVPWGLWHSILREKKSKVFFSLERLSFFSKISFQQPIGFFKFCSYYFRSESKITSWTLTKCSLRFVLLDNSFIREKSQNLFFTRKIALFFKNLCFQKTS